MVWKITRLLFTPMAILQTFAKAPMLSEPVTSKPSNCSKSLVLIGEGTKKTRCCKEFTVMLFLPKKIWKIISNVWKKQKREIIENWVKNWSFLKSIRTLVGD